MENTMCNPGGYSNLPLWDAVRTRPKRRYASEIRQLQVSSMRLRLNFHLVNQKRWSETHQNREIEYRLYFLRPSGAYNHALDGLYLILRVFRVIATRESPLSCFRTSGTLT